MSVAEPPSITPFPLPDSGPPDPQPPPRPKVKKLRLTLIVLGLGGLALVSTVFGMMMAVASDLPQLENEPRFRHARNSTLIDAHGRPLGLVVSNQNLVLVGYDQISPAMRHAIISIEDRRFYTNSGVDIRGIARAFAQDIVNKGAVQGGSTITQQFVKNALEAQGNRTVFQKLREAALAYHLTRKWSKEKILTEYLNAIYFGNGAYGVESAARVYFGGEGADHAGCGTRGQPACASLLRPEEAALLAGMVSNPSAYDPVAHWPAALARRNLVLRNMLEQGFITRSDYDRGLAVTAPPVVQPPTEQSEAPYFTSWVRQQLVDRFGADRAFRGGLRVRTTIDLDMQNAAQQAVNNYLASPTGPTAALVAIDNQTGEVRAMVGGRDFAQTPFNLATQGERQPGSAFKPFVLAAALRKGISPTSTWASRKKIFTVPNSGGKEKFVVNNYEGAYSGVSTLARATTFSDNSVYAEVGFKVGFKRIAQMARSMGIRSPVSTNPAISLGGLKHGVSALDMAHAYETLAQGGQRVEGSLASNGGPSGIRDVEAPTGDGYKKLAENKPHLKRIFSKRLADVEKGILQSVVAVGTGVRAQLPGTVIAGKTGTTENYGDAWFVGFTDRLTVAVWVGYPDGVRPMKTEFRGEPVAGGTYPTLIWHDFMSSALRILASRDAARRLKEGLPAQDSSTLPTTPAAPVTPATEAPSTQGGKANPAPQAKQKSPAPKKPTPAPAPQPAEPPPGEDTGGTGGTGGTGTP